MRGSTLLLKELGCGHEGARRDQAIEADGRRLVRQTGSHRQFRHPIKVEGTKQMTGYAVIIEQGETSYGAYAPELPGLGVAGNSIEEVERLIREAIPLHIESLRAHGDPVPPPPTVATAVIPAPAALTSTASDPQA
jgi:predicted RNase H-like HicB family nuclease